ncbi:hypothetical protein [Deinococcus metallilatus]|uniref:Uncharacterized protein n=1 Tax=Deinococcus metallilatus TaxID=1211322 RepID=A0ABR6MZV0_9DEIO|nr:hypothetical protein [Deinococcus metallilatus]MBB5297478.1 hypothetical protein [Deinococcus metallilatus]GMA14380.1 hypothetical protein GCM10025871_07110 [Deinococcus metallilatus]
MIGGQRLLRGDGEMLEQALEVACRCLAQRVLLIRELKGFREDWANRLGGGSCSSWNRQQGFRSGWQAVVDHHLAELPVLERHCAEACSAWQTVKAPGAPLTTPAGIDAWIEMLIDGAQPWKEGR